MSSRTPLTLFRSRIKVHHAVRWLAAISWTVLVVALMLMPGQDTAADDLSHFFGGTDITDAAGHVFLFGVLVLLWLLALVTVLLRSRALRLAVAIGLALGLVTELLQVFVPHRGVAFIDLFANALGPALVFGLQRWLPSTLLEP